MHTSIFKLQFLYFFLFLGGGGGKKIIDTFFYKLYLCIYYLCGNFSKQNIIFTKEFLNNENSLIFTAKKRYHFQKMADKIRVISIIGELIRDIFSGHRDIFYLCVQRRFRLEFAFARRTISMISITTSTCA